MAESFQELASLGRLLSDDVKKCLDELDHDPDNQFKRRAVVHFLFAFIEGQTFLKKQNARFIYENLRIGNFSEQQIAWLKNSNPTGNRSTQEEFPRGLKTRSLASLFTGVCMQCLHMRR